MTPQERRIAEETGARVQATCTVRDAVLGGAAGEVVELLGHRACDAIQDAMTNQDPTTWHGAHM